MVKQLKQLIRRVFHLRREQPISFYLTHLLFKYLLRQNAEVPWAVHHSSIVYHPERIVRGKDVYPGDSPGNFIDASNGLVIGDFTNLGPNVGLISKNHDLVDNRLYTQDPPIRIGAFCWLGMGVVVLPGIELGDHTVVGANAVVTHSFPKGYCVLAGNPAVVIKELDRETCKRHQLARRLEAGINKPMI
jgi:acetyltransferase-like isoleucine patch superfamily enzyme